jgi:PAS domain S-box-containing protein
LIGFQVKTVLKAFTMENNRYETILYSIGDGVIVTDEKGLIEKLNPIAEMLTGWKESDAKNLPISKVFRIINEDTREEVENPVERVLRDGQIVGLANHTLLLSKDGRELPITDSGAPVIDNTGKMTGSVLVFRDQTAERVQQKKIERSEMLYKGLFAAIHDGICLHQLVMDEKNKPVDYIILDLNHKYEDITGLTRQQVIGKKAIDAYKTDTPPYLEIYSKVAISGESCSFETYFPPMEKHFKISVFSLENGIFATVFLDITAQKRREQSLLDSNRIFEHARDMLCIAGFDGFFKIINPSWSRILGWSDEELLSAPWLEFVHPDDKEGTQNIKSTLIDGKEVYQFENRYLSKDGSVKWLSWNSFPYPEEGIMYGVARDITVQKNAESELEKYRNHLEELVKGRTTQLENNNRELERLNSLFVGREFRIVELKNKIKELDDELKLYRS